MGNARVYLLHNILQEKERWYTQEPEDARSLAVDTNCERVEGIRREGNRYNDL